MKHSKPLLLAALSFMAVLASIALAPSSNWTVTWFPIQEGIGKYIYNVSIQNMDPALARDFNLSLLIENTSFDRTKLSGVGIYEWKNITYTGWQLSGNVTYHNDWNATKQSWNNWTEVATINTSTTTYVMEWKPSKSGGLDGKGKLNSGAINIPKLGSKEKDSTVNGTKWFQVRFTAPIVSNGAGWGSIGKVAFIEESQGYEYHPWWDVGWPYMRPITLHGDKYGLAHLNEPTALHVDTAALITAGKLQADCDDLRITDNSTTEQELTINITDCNTADTTIYFPANASNRNETYHLYYGNSLAAAPAAWDPSGTFKNIYANTTDLAEDKTYTHDIAPWAGYPDTGTLEMTDYIFDDTLYSNAAWTGWRNPEQAKLNFTIDMGASPPITYRINVSGLYDTANGINTATAQFYGRNASQAWTSLGVPTRIIMGNAGRYNETLSFRPAAWRYISVYMDTFVSTWVFLDEAVVLDGLYLPAYLGSEQIFSMPPQWSSPSNITTATGFLSINVTWADDADNAVNATLLEINVTGFPRNYTNTTWFAANITNWNVTLAEGGTFSWRMFANDSSNAQNVTSNFATEWLTGLNVSASNCGNGTVTALWNLTVYNSSDAGDVTGLAAPYLARSWAYPSGSVTLRASADLFKNGTATRTMNTTGITQVPLCLYRWQEFRANNILTGSNISSFAVTVANSTASASGSTAVGRLLIGLDELPRGAVNITWQATEYAPNITTATLDGSSELNLTIQLMPAGLGLTAYDEVGLGQLYYNVTLANSTATTTYQNISYLYMAYANNSLPKGDITLTVSRDGYGQRVYYANINPNTWTNISAYLLSTAVGSYVRFHILTATDQGISGALVQANTSIGGASTLVGQMLSDGTGTALFFLNPLTTYTITAGKTGYITASYSVAPSQSDYKIYLTATGAGSNISSMFLFISWSLVPAAGSLQNESTLFNYTVGSTNNSLYDYGMNISSNGTLLFNGTGSSPSGGSVFTTIDLANYSGLNVEVFTWFNSTEGYYSANRTYYVWSTVSGLYGFLTTLGTTLCPTPITKLGVSWCPPLNLIALLISMVMGAVVAVKFSFNGGGAVAAATLWLFVWLGWWPMLMALMLTLAMVGFIILKGGAGG